MSERIIFYLKRGAAILAALIFLQTLYFKFSAHPDSVYIFTKIGGEPYLPKGSGIAELGIGLLLLYPKTSHYGALPRLLLMLGAIGQYQFVPGINVNNHGGTLFALALITLISCVIVLVLKRKNWGHL